jgi:hypothetical protein
MKVHTVKSVVECGEHGVDDLGRLPVELELSWLILVKQGTHFGHNFVEVEGFEPAAIDEFADDMQAHLARIASWREFEGCTTRAIAVDPGDNVAPCIHLLQMEENRQKANMATSRGNT